MKVYQTDYTGDGRFLAEIDADPDPMLEGEWLVPAGCVSTPPPQAVLPNYARWTGDEWEVFTPTPVEDPEPAPEPVLPGPDVVIILYPGDLWRRTTDEEAEAIEAAMATQPARLRNLFTSAQSYRSDDPMWPLLQEIAEQLFGEERAANLLQPSLSPVSSAS